MRKNSLDASRLIFGVSYGEHVMNAEGLVKDLQTLLEGRANGFLVRLWKNTPLSRETFLELARFAVEKNMPFGFLYATQHAPEGMISHITPELCSSLREIAGDLFLGEVYGEAGSEVGAKDKGYFTENKRPNHAPMPSQDTCTMQLAADSYVKHLEEMSSYSRAMDMGTMIVEATALSRYALRAGIDIPILEACPGNVERLVPFTRGAAIGYDRKYWGSFIAHEWYAGFDHEDLLKVKRLTLFYKYLYMSGANIILLESGGTELRSFGFEYPYDSPLCRNYRHVMEESFRFMTEKKRLPAGPVATVAFIQGEDDGFTDFMGGSVWCRFDREEWGKGSPERSWDILKDVYRSADWQDPHAYAGHGMDLTGAPAWGSYDILPSETPLKVLENYDYLIFLGWNTMRRELYSKLIDYVKNGGTLLMSLAHLNENSDRACGSLQIVNDGDLTELFGCKFTGSFRCNHGVKFSRNSFVPGLHYPGTADMMCDPIYPEGFVDYGRIALMGGTSRAVLADRFTPPGADQNSVVIENRCGKGTAILTTHLAYPGDPAVKPLYSRLVKGLLAASHANAELQIAGSDKVRFSVFTDGVNRELYLLNTGFDTDACVTVVYGNMKFPVVLKALELRCIPLGQGREAVKSLI